jgi:hypothetical protein
MCFDFFHKSAWIISHSNNNSARYNFTYVFTWNNKHSCQILIKLNFLDTFSKNTQISNLTKIRPVWPELFHEGRHTDGHTDGETDMKKLIIASPNFANAHKNGCLKSSCRNKHSLYVLINVKDQSTAGARSNMNKAKKQDVPSEVFAASAQWNCKLKHQH